MTAWLLTLMLGQPVLAGCPPPEVSPTLRGSADVEAARLALLRCVRADLQAQDWTQADRRLSSARRAGDTLTTVERAQWRMLVDELTATRVIDAHAWDEAPALTASMTDASAWLRDTVNAIADARRAWRSQDLDTFDRVLRVASSLQALAAESGDPRIERAARLVQAAAAGGQYERDEMQLLLEEAHRSEARQRAALGEQYVPVVIAAELEADLWLQTDRYARAAEMYRQVLAQHPARVQSWRGLAESYRRLGHEEAADDADRRAVEVAAGVRVPSPP